VEIVAEFKPRFVVIENVPGIVKVPGNSTYRRFLKALSSLSYNFAAGRLDAKWYGVPQTRRRWIVIAALNTQPALPESTHGPHRSDYQTVRNAIAHYPRIKAGTQHPSIPNHRAAKLSALNIQRLRKTPLDGGRRTDWPKSLALPCHSDDYEGHTDVYGRMWWDAPAPALTCRCISLSNGRYGHPQQHRAISLREAARLQSFEDEFVFYGSSLTSLASQIGNAVPVKLAEAVARQVMGLAAAS
jgi:DNA (cytosine-5)-methyltransferase 1